IDDGVEDDGGLSCLAVADDQLALPAPNRNHRVDGLDAGLKGFAHRLPVQNPRRDALKWIALLGGDRPFAIERLAEWIHNPAHERVTDGHGHDRVRALDDVALLQCGRFTEKHDADLILFEVQGNAEHAVRESEHFPGHDLFESVDTRNAVADADDGADFVDRN